MDRRRLLAVTGTTAATLLAGCSGGSGTDTAEPAATETETDTPTTSSGTPSSASANDHLRTVYEAWVKLDADAFLATLHSTNNHPEDEVRSSTEDLDFEGTLVELNAEIVNDTPDADAISQLFETGPNLSEDDVSTFTDVQTVIASVAPTVDGETTNDAQANFKSFLETEKRHMLAVEDEEWRFVL